VPAGRALPLCPAPLPDVRRAVAPPGRPALPPVCPLVLLLLALLLPPALAPRLGAPRVPPLFAGRRAPVPVPADWPRRSAPPPELLREVERPPLPLLPCPAPPDRAGRADPPDRAEGARRFGWGEFWGIG